MLNKEKYKNELEGILLNSLAVTINGDIEECKNICDCCEECIFYNGNCGGYEEAKKWLLSEYKEPTLTEEEKAYITEVIKPFRDKVTGILKGDNGSEFIRIFVENDGAFRLPYFKKGSMYKNMKTNKKYKLEELGL